MPRRPRSRRDLHPLLRHHGRLPLLVLATLAVLVVVGIVAVSQGRGTVARLAAGAAPTPAAVTDVAAAFPVAVLGDSISQGTPYGGRGATNWTQLVGRDRGWTVTNTAVGGTGYVNAGASAPFQTAQLERAVAARPRLVVVQGSRNDVGLPVDQIGAAASRLYRELDARVPDARLVVIGPFWNPGTSQKALAVRDTLAAAARDAGATFIDPMAENWFAGAYDGGPLIGGDGVHPTDAGHALYASRLEADLTRLGL